MVKNDKTDNKTKGLVDIKGKQYLQVNGRLLQFHDLYPNGSIITEIITDDTEKVVMICTITPDVEKPERQFNGIAQEVKNSTFINKTSHYENCETSARGRALGNLGLGIEESLASAEEVANAMMQQDEQKTLESMKVQVLRLMNLFEQCKNWIPIAIEKKLVKEDILPVSLDYVLNSKSVVEAEKRVGKLNIRFTKEFDKLNKLIEKEKAQKPQTPEETKKDVS